MNFSHYSTDDHQMQAPQEICAQIFLLMPVRSDTNTMLFHRMEWLTKSIHFSDLGGIIHE
jgi:hypothetical protein